MRLDLCCFLASCASLERHTLNFRFPGMLGWNARETLNPRARAATKDSWNAQHSGEGITLGAHTVSG